MQKARIVVWKSPFPPEGVVEVLESTPNLLQSLLDTTVDLSKNKKKLLLFFCGNPGLVEFYYPLCEEMEARDVECLVVGLVGHSLTDRNHGRLFSLQDQIDQATQLACLLLSEHTVDAYKGKLYVGGHSIGAYISFQLLARFPQFKMYFGLAPVVSRIMESPNGQRMFYWGTFVLQWVAAFLGSLFPLLPTCIRSYVVHSHGRAVDEELRHKLTSHLHRKLLWNIFFMSMDEFRMLVRPDVALLRSQQEKMVMYYVKTDGWVPLPFAEEIKNYCPRLRAWILEEDALVPHAWCLQHTHAVVKAISPFL